MHIVEKSKWYNLCFRACLTRKELISISEAFLRRVSDDRLVSTISVQDQAKEQCTRFVYAEGNEKYYQQELERLIQSGEYVTTRDRLVKNKPYPNEVCLAPTEQEVK